MNWSTVIHIVYSLKRFLIPWHPQLIYIFLEGQLLEFVVTDMGYQKDNELVNSSTHSLFTQERVGR